MSKDKRKLHDRAMKLLNKIGSKIPYMCEYGIGDSKELRYLKKNNFVKIIREPKFSPFGNHMRQSFVVPTGVKK